jgi:hypothetical protein
MAVHFSTQGQISPELEFRDTLLSADVNKINFMLKNGADPSIDNNFGINCIFSKMQSYLSCFRKGACESYQTSSKSSKSWSISWQQPRYKLYWSHEIFLAIRLASQYGHIEVLKLLLNHPKVDPSANNNIGMNFISLNIFKAIQLASRNGHIEVVKFLLNLPKVDPSADDSIGMNFVDLITYLKQFDWLHSMVILK